MWSILNHKNNVIFRMVSVDAKKIFVLVQAKAWVWTTTSI